MQNEPSRIPEVMEAVEEFAQSMDLMLDQKKTFAWAADAESRARLRRAGLRVAQSAKDLGAQMQYTRKTTNAAITACIGELKPLWKLLAQSCSPYFAKVRARRASAWSRAFYGVSISQLGGEHYQQLRTGAMRGLRMSKSGTCPLIHLSLVESPTADAEFYAIKSSFRDFRQFANPEHVTRLGEIANGFVGGKTAHLRLWWLVWFRRHSAWHAV